MLSFETYIKDTCKQRILKIIFLGNLKVLKGDDYLVIKYYLQTEDIKSHILRNLEGTKR